MRTEKDSMGEVEVPENAYYGVHTQRSLNNFKISRNKWHPRLIHAITHIKLACANANYKLGLITKDKTEAIQKACIEILADRLPNEFPLDIFQSGSGTSTNMNVNEVIANRADEFLGEKKGSKKVHPNDDVNKGQSTNNVIPSAIRVACCSMMPELTENLKVLVKAFETKSNEFKDILKSARTHLQDAVPITLGQEFQAYATALAKHKSRLEEAELRLKVLGIGGTAVGTGINTHPRFRELVVKYLSRETQLRFKVTADGVESTQFLTDIAGLSSVLKLIAIDLNKIANDLRLLSSGPKTGLGEINLPAVEPGSSIMPGKVNPVIAEATNMVYCQVVGNDAAITTACANGTLDLNTHMPIIGHNIVESVEIISNVLKTLKLCVEGITANADKCKYYVEHSMALATALNPKLGYDKVAELVKESLATGKTVKELVISKALMEQKELDEILNPKKLTSPNLK